MLLANESVARGLVRPRRAPIYSMIDASTTQNAFRSMARPGAPPPAALLSVPARRAFRRRAAQHPRRGRPLPAAAAP